jgi:plastocyanin
MMRSRFAAIGAASLLTLALAACGGSSGGTAAPASASAPASAPASSAAASGGASPSAGGSSAAVCAPGSGTGQVQANAKGFAFDPATVTVPAGQSVTWTNGDSASHSIVLDGGQCKSEPFAGGATTTLQFNVAGSYPFHCGIHPTMKGTIEVTG